MGRDNLSRLWGTGAVSRYLTLALGAQGGGAMVEPCEELERGLEMKAHLAGRSSLPLGMGWLWEQQSL